MKKPKFGYHNKLIQKGVYGELSKIREEFEELEDAATQGIKIMELCELADLWGAMRMYLKTHFPGVKMNDLHKMAKATRAAFKQRQQ
jgi:phosphoribosyl-ATP pyrophosphohydrolase